MSMGNFFSAKRWLALLAFVVLCCWALGVNSQESRKKTQGAAKRPATQEAVKPAAEMSTQSTSRTLEPQSATAVGQTESCTDCALSSAQNTMPATDSQSGLFQQGKSARLNTTAAKVEALDVESLPKGKKGEPAATGLTQPQPVKIQMPQGILPLRSTDKQHDNDGKKESSKPKDSGVISDVNSPQAWQTIFSEGFEGAFPGGNWDISYSSDAPYFWKDVSHQARTGSWSGWCAGGTISPNPVLNPATDNYVNNMNSWMIYGPFDLSDATDAKVDFYSWLDSEVGFDYLWWAASTTLNGDYYGFRISGNSNGYQSQSFDLKNVPTLGDLTGQSQVFVAFLFQTDVSVTHRGAFLDDIVIQKFTSGVAPTLISPVAGATLDNGRTDFLDDIIWDFDWSNVSGATQYNLYVKLPSAQFAVIDLGVSSSSFHYVSNAYIVESNRFGWEWKVRAMTSGVWGPWSETRTFNVEPPNTDPPQGGGAELVADRMYLRTGPNSGSEVNDPTTGQQYYIHFDWRNTGSVAASNFRLELRLNGAVQCSNNSQDAGPNSSNTTWCTAAVTWPTSDNFITGVLDVNNIIAEPNESNNTSRRDYPNGVPPLTVFSPAAGVTWEVGTRQTVTWNPTGATGNVNIKLSTNGGSSYPITLASNIANDGSKGVDVPDNPSPTCRVKVELVSNTSVFGASEIFTIQRDGATITVTSPLAGAIWPVGTSQSVLWTSSGVTGNVNIKLSTNGGASFLIDLALNTANDGNQPVTVPNNPSNTCRVRVESVSNSNVFDDNPGNFTIQPVVECQLTWQANLTVRDTGNNTETLTFGQAPSATNDLDTGCGEADLPPVPPAGVFDARFELPVSPIKASLKDYRNDSEQAIDWRARFQAGTSGAIVFSWNPADFPAGSFFLKDEITGTLVNVNMNAQNSYTLTNTAITSLKIEYSNRPCRDVNVISNWNIVSVPVLATSMNVSSLFPTAISSAFAFNNGYVSTTTLQNGVGYWIKFANAGPIQICGTQASSRDIPVNSGWNIIGPLGSDVQVSAITSVPGGIVVSSYFGYNNGYTSATTLNVGKGYWVKVSQAGVLHLPSTSSPAKMWEDDLLSSVPSREADPSWPMVVVQDCDGNVGKLYFSPESELDGAFELPPVPPAGIFDLRFSNDRYVAVMQDGSVEILLNSAKYPIRMRAQNLGPNASLRVKDNLNGGVLNETVTDGKEIIITTALNKIVVESGQMPLRYGLSQNHPNPFNPTTIVKFSLPEKSYVKLAVYNLLGEKVSELVNREMDAGDHQVSVDARGYSAGVYFYVFEAGNFKDVKKMMVVK